MRKNTLRVLSSVMCLVFLVSLVFQAPLMASTQTIPVRVGDQLINVTPGQWVSVNTPTGKAHFNVRFVNGQPVALEMSQYTRLVFGDAALAGTGTTGSTGAGQTTGRPVGSSGSVAGSVADDIAQSAGQTAQTPRPSVAGSVADDIAQSTSQTTPRPANNQAGQQLELPFDQPQTTPRPANNQAGQQLELPFDQPQTTGQGVGMGSVADDVAQATGQTTSAPRRAWDPSRHPRDPQTGRFISHEEAVQRGLMDPPPSSGQAGQSGQTNQTPGSVADDIAQSGSVADDLAAGGNVAGQVADDVAAGGVAGQVADDVAAAGTDGRPTVGDRFRSGYETGKGLTNQGFQNVKDSLRSGFSARNLLMTAGITVGVDLATQVMRGEKPSIGKALKTVASAEFVGGVGGAVLGAAGGSFFVPFLSAIPVVGGALSALAPAFGSIVGSSMGAYLAGDLKNGRFSIREAFRRIDWVGVTGQAIGSTVGAALGSALGPIGTIAGGMVGGYLGNWAAQKIAGMFGRGQAANLPTLAMPTGGATVGGSGIGIGQTPVNQTAGPVSGNTTDDVLVIGGTGAVIGDYESEVALAYSKYQELYKLYNEMLRQGRNEDALSVAEAMNQAKREYDTLRTQK